jgi:type II secretory ATPase GspE/PulE/Tfp pilus assembly ATPase PilB-like protein
MSTLPTVHGESLVVRLLDQTMPAQSFRQLGLPRRKQPRCTAR